MADPDLHLRGGGEGGGLKKIFCRPLVSSKNKARMGGEGGRGGLPWIRHCTGIRQTKEITISNEMSSVFGLSQCVSYSPTRQFCTT